VEKMMLTMQLTRIKDLIILGLIILDSIILVEIKEDSTILKTNYKVEQLLLFLIMVNILVDTRIRIGI